MTMLSLVYYGLCLVYAGIILAYLVHLCMAVSAEAGEAEAEKTNERGLTAEELEMLEEGKMAAGGGEECAVCLENMAQGQAARVLPGCHHAFHRHCVDAWLQLHPVCPLCRARLLPPPQHQPQPQSQSQSPPSLSLRLSSSPAVN
ncbi:E3 ubiquitin-protein ligase ATL23-like [Cocos nucifera]|nr:E3 ubiquitin-protein ligase ATL23-like [Cocos nucifera]